VLEAFLLTRAYRETREGLVLEFWASSARGPLRLRVHGQTAVFFVEHTTPTLAGKRRGVALQSLEGRAVDAVYFDSQRELVRERERLVQADTWAMEADVQPAERYLMERFITGACWIEGNLSAGPGFLEVRNPELKPAPYAPKLRALAIDIETHGLHGALFSIAFSCDEVEQVLMVGSGDAPANTTLFPNEAAVMSAFATAVHTLDPDLILGWNVVDFDIAFLLRRAHELGIALGLGRDGSEPRLGTTKPARAMITGRVVLDGISTLRAASYQLDSYALTDVAQQLLGRGKLLEHAERDRVAEIQRLYTHDRAALARYNLEDCRLTREIFAKADLVGFLVERAQLTGLPLDRARGAVAAFDYLYLPRLHRAGYVAPSVGAASDVRSSPGGYVLESAPGLYENVIVLDFKSLYPSIIRSFFVDPLGLHLAADDAVEGFAGARFHRECHILPELISTLWQARDDAKRRNDAARSYAIKILMNSFYGVLGTTACRFFDRRLASSITLRGHEIIIGSRDYIEKRGFRVIYGDTDSLFVRLDARLGAAECAQHGARLAAELNAFWQEAIARIHRLQSHLEVQFATHYLQFFMPTLRDSEQGSKKRYAGLLRTATGDHVEFKGLEAVRNDWTPLARRFQRELYRRIFGAEPYEDYVREISQRLTAGEFDAELVYRKRIRRELDAYVKNVPPHVRAARQLVNPTRMVSYCMTINGPEPAQDRTSRLDYAHYLDRQLAPAADAILQHRGTSFARITQQQLELFDRTRG
jgi:DNA polymerase-2